MPTTPRSARGILVGGGIALLVPVAFLAAAILVQNGIPVIVRDASTSQTLTGIALSEAFLGPIGLLVAGSSAGIRGAVAWIVGLVIAVPVLAFFWFLCVATLSGALGSPF